MILVGDIGNTETKICLVNAKNEIVKKISLPSKNISNLILNKKFKLFNLSNKKKIKCLFCSVVPKTFQFIRSYIKKKYKIKCFELKDLKLNRLIKIKVNKKQIGADRLANAIGISDNKNNYIIIDFGTATTFDAIVKNVYYGGVIAPGVKLSLNTLINKASLIPKLNLKKVDKVIGLNTISAVRSGFFWGYGGLIENILNLIKKETKKSFKIIMTGGFSYLFKKPIKLKVIIDEDITIKGLIKSSDLIK